MSKIAESIVCSTISFAFLAVGLIQGDTVSIIIASLMILCAGTMLGIGITINIVEEAENE